MQGVGTKEGKMTQWSNTERWAGTLRAGALAFVALAAACSFEVNVHVSQQDRGDGVEPAEVVEPDVLDVPDVPEYEDLSETPTFTPMTVRPEILNRTEIMRAMEREYPPLLRDAGVGGDARAVPPGRYRHACTRRLADHGRWE